MFLLVIAALFFLPFFAQTPVDEGLVASYLFQGSAEDTKGLA